MSEFSLSIGKIPYEGKASRNALAFKYDNPDEIIDGEPILSLSKSMRSKRARSRIRSAAAVRRCSKQSSITCCLACNGFTGGWIPLACLLYGVKKRMNKDYVYLDDLDEDDVDLDDDFYFSNDPCDYCPYSSGNGCDLNCDPDIYCPVLGSD